MKPDMSINQLTDLFRQKFSIEPERVDLLPRSGSDRQYARLQAGNISVLGAMNADINENEAFFSFSRSFSDIGIRVPEVLAISGDRQHYLLTDLGQETLYQRIISNERGKPCSSTLCLLKDILSDLLRIQVEGARVIDFSKCWPRPRFDRQSIMWDLSYFKYNFLKLTRTTFDEQALEDDFSRLADFLLEAPAHYFMYRDFQARNIMLLDGNPWFIDYQGGRLGPLQYDLASLLYSPKTGLNEVQREVMLDYYLEKLQAQIPVDRELFISQYYGFVLVRILQALGAYGFRGIFEQKPDFRSSIPQAIKNLNVLAGKHRFGIELPELFRLIDHLGRSEWAKPFVLPEGRLTIRVTSFSYRKGIPVDPSENGGGFVFDCRGLPNPGRYAGYRTYSGKDQPVIEYFEGFDEPQQFHESAKQMVGLTVKEYLSRGFKHLCISFGCTGGQHRSVYQAEKMARWLQNNFDVDLVILHTEQENWKNHV